MMKESEKHEKNRKNLENDSFFLQQQKLRKLLKCFSVYLSCRLMFQLELVNNETGKAYEMTVHLEFCMNTLDMILNLFQSLLLF